MINHLKCSNSCTTPKITHTNNLILNMALLRTSIFLNYCIKNFGNHKLLLSLTFLYTVNSYKNNNICKKLFLKQN